MPEVYNLQFIEDNDTLQIGFIDGEPHTNKELVVYVHNEIVEMIEDYDLGGKFLRIKGDASDLIMAVLMSKLSDLFNVIAIYNIGSSAYIVISSDDSLVDVGDTLPE